MDATCRIAERVRRCNIWNATGALRKNLLAIHVNYLGREDATLLGRRGVHVAHCPRSHAYFKHRRFPHDELAGAGINICLGTDSLASLDQPRKRTAELSLFEEMRMLAKNQPSLSPKKIVRMATVNGARALGMAGQVGELAEKAYADIIAIPYDGNIEDAAEAAVNHRGHVAASMIDGQWALAPQMIAPMKRFSGAPDERERF